MERNNTELVKCQNKITKFTYLLQHKTILKIWQYLNDTQYLTLFLQDVFKMHPVSLSSYIQMTAIFYYSQKLHQNTTLILHPLWCTLINKMHSSIIEEHKAAIFWWQDEILAQSKHKLKNILETQYNYSGRALNHVLEITPANTGYIYFPLKFILPGNSSYGSFTTTTHYNNKTSCL